LEAVTSRLKKFESLTQALTARLVPQQDLLTKKFRERISGGDGGASLEEADAGKLTGKIAEATVLFSDIRAFTTYSERLTSDEIAELLNAYLGTACAPIIRCGGVIMKFIGDGVMALFEARPNQAGESHSRRAVRAGLAMQLAALEFREWVRQHHPSKSLPEFSIGVGIHSGEVLLCHVGTPGRGELTVVGDSVNIAARLEDQNKELGWAVVASEATVSAAGSAVVVGSRRTIQLRGRSAPTEAFEIIGIAAGDSDDAPVQIPEDMREALSANARIAGDAAKAALGITLSIMTGEFGEKRLMIQGYRVVSKIGRGGSSIVYLAERESDKQQVVLKILNATAGLDEIMLQRFVQEFDIISSIDHPNVVKIYDRGFSDRHAYIAMEYFPDGSLVEVISKGLSARQALSLLAQAASALREVHGRGIVHRDIKPGNLMGARRRQHRSRRFRHRKATRRRPGPHAARRALRNPLLRFTGADRRKPRDDAVRYLLPRNHFLRNVDEPAPVRGRIGVGVDRAARQRAAAEAAGSACQVSGLARPDGRRGPPQAL